MKWISSLASGALSMVGGSWINLALIAAVLAMLGSGIGYIVHLNNSVSTLTANNAILDSALTAEKELVAKREFELTRQHDTVANLSKAMNRAVIERAALEKRLVAELGKLKDLVASAKKNPTEAEARINQTMASALRCNEIATGSTLTAEEDAGISLNQICPDLIASKRKSK